MTETTNLGLKKIDGSENWRQIFDYHNDSMDKADSTVAAVQDGLAIVANGNTHASVAKGRFVYVRNHSTLAEGLYKASSAIQTNGELTASNLTAAGSGGLNDLQEQVISLNSNIPSVVNNLTSTSGTDALSAAQGKALNDKFSSSTSGGSGYLTIKKHNKIAAVSVAGGFSSVTIPAGFRPAYTAYIACVGTQGGVYFPALVTINTNGAVSVTTHYNWATAAGASGVNLYGSGAYIVA